MVLGSNRRKHWVSGRAVYALRTNGKCSVIMRGGGRLGDMMRPVIKQGRQAGWEADVTQGRSFSLSILPTSLTRTSVWESRQGGGGATEETWCILELRDSWMCSHKCINKDAEAFSFYSYVSLYGLICVFILSVFPVCLFMYECVCLIVQSQHNLLTACMATEGCRPDTWEPRLRSKESGMLSVGSSGNEADS